jgi:hypothetical protein
MRVRREDKEDDAFRSSHSRPIDASQVYIFMGGLTMAAKVSAAVCAF